MWFLAWTPHALAHLENPFFSQHINYPGGVNLMWNALMFLPGLVLAPFTLWLGPVLTFNVMTTASVALTGWCGYLAARRFAHSPAAAILGGLVYGFGPYMSAHARGHPNLIAAFVPPLLLIALHEVLVRQRRPAWQSGLVVGLLCTAQFYITQELLATEAVAIVLGIMILAVSHPRAVRERVPYAAKSLGWTLIALVVLTGGPLLVQFFGEQRISGVVQQKDYYVSDLLNFVLPTQAQQFAPDGATSITHDFTGNISEWNAYLGAPLLIFLVVVTARLWREPLVRFAALLGASMAVLSLGPQLHVHGNLTGIPLPWRAVDWLPVLENVLPSRLALFTDLMAALLVARGLEAMVGWARIPRRSARLAGGLAVIGAAVLPLLPAVDFPTTAAATPPFFTDGEAERIPPDTVVLVAPMQQLFPADPMLWQAEAGFRFRMPQGYFLGPDASGHAVYGSPLSTMSTAMEQLQGGAMPTVNDSLRQQFLADMHARDVSMVLVGPMDRQDEMLGFLSAILGTAPEADDGVFIWWQIPQ
jgi:hypothetical protein